MVVFPGPQGGGGVTASTGLTDSSNLARLNAANAFTNANTISKTAGVPLILNGVFSSGSHIQEWNGALNGGTPLAFFDDAGNFNMSGGNGNFVCGGNISYNTITKVNNVVTASGNGRCAFGTPTIYDSGRLTAQAALVASVATYTPAADGSFIISANVLVVTAGTLSMTVTVAYKDEGGTSRTTTLTFSNPLGTLGTTIIGSGLLCYQGLPLRIRAKAGTAIVVATAGTFTGSPSYNVEADITQVG